MPLGKNADAGDYVKDFYKSKAPQFKGKSKNKRRQMAIAAYLDARDKGKAKSEDMTFKVEVDGLPAMYIDGNSPGQVKNHLRKLIKQPSMIKGVSRMTKYDMKKTYRAKAQGKDVEEEDMSGYLKSIGGPSHRGKTATSADIAAINKHLRDTRKQRVRSHPLGYKHFARSKAASSGLGERYDYPHGTAKAYKAATPGQEKGDGYMEPKQEAARIPRKKGQPANSKKHSDLYTDENPKGTIHGLKFATVADAKASVAKIKKSGRKHAHKIQAAIAMEQRARVAGKNAEAAVYRKYINAMKKKTKNMQELFTIGHTRSYDAAANRAKQNLKHGSKDPMDKRFGTKVGGRKGAHGGVAYKTAADAAKGAKELKKDFPGRKYSVYKMKGDFNKDTYHSKKTGMNHIKRDTEITRKVAHNVSEDAKEFAMANNKEYSAVQKQSHGKVENYIVKQYKNGKTTGVVKRFKGLKQATAHADKQGGDHRVHKEDSHGVRRLPLGKRNPDNPIKKQAKDLLKTIPPSKPLKDLVKMDELKYTTMNKYMSKAKRSMHTAKRSHDANILRGTDPSKDKATVSKRAKGIKLAKSRAVDKIRKGHRADEEFETIKTGPGYRIQRDTDTGATRRVADREKDRKRATQREADAMDMVRANNAQSKKGYKTEKLSIPKIRNIMYKGAKTLGDVQAVRKKKVGKRVARRVAGKLASRALRSLIKNDVQEGKGGKPESFEAQYKRRLVKTTKPEHKEKGYNWRIKGKDRPEISIKLYKSKPGQAEFNKQLRRVAGHEFGG
tara:strand:- start:1131 stop:3473 length:2343 start_codon:yes stop_codon:yes gene_type:complete